MVKSMRRSGRSRSNLYTLTETYADNEFRKDVLIRGKKELIRHVRTLRRLKRHPQPGAVITGWTQPRDREGRFVKV